MEPTGGRASGDPEPAPRRFRFPKGERILRRADFQRVYEGGIKRHGRFCVAFGQRTQAERSRIGITATRKIGKAHDRNRYKRWVRETWRRERHSTGIDLLPADVVVNVKTNARDASFADFSNDLLTVLRRLAADLSRSG